jgi:membrane-anchored glycerophosphoryl diester phosphodiesterase (GDPDase)
MTDGPGSTPDPHQRPDPWATPDARSPQTGGSQTGGPHPGGTHPPGYPPGYPPAGGPGYYPPQAPRPGIVPLRPLGLGDILDGTVKLIRSNPKVTLGLSAVVGVVAGLPVAVWQAAFALETNNPFTDPGAAQTEPLAGGSLGASVVPFASLLVTFVATALLTGLLIRVVGRAVFGVRTTAREAWAVTRPRVWQLLGQTLLVMAVIALPVVLVSGSLMVAGVATESQGLLVVGGLSLVVWVPYVAFMGTRLIVAPAALVLENLSALDAMRRSWRLVRGDTWRVFGIVLLTQILIGVVSGVVSLPFSLGGMALTAFGGDSPAVTGGAAILIAIGETVTAMLTYPFTAGVYGLLYADRRMRAEAFDLELQTAAARPGETSIDDLWQPRQPGPPQP